MKTFIVFIILSLALSDTTSHPLSSVILGLSQMATKDFNFQQLFTALDELSAAFQTRINEENSVYETEFLQYQSEVQFYTNQITDFTNKIAQLEVEVKDQSDEKVRLQELLSTTNQDLVDATKLLNAKEAEITSDDSLFQSQNQEYSDTINVLDQAISLLNEINDEASLVQKKQHIQEVSQKMHKNFKSLSQKRVFYQPLVKALTQISQNNYVDQEHLNKVVTFMSQLRQSLIDNQISLQNQHNSQSQLQQNMLGELQAKVSGLSDVLIPLLETEISVKESEIRTLNSILQDARQNLSDAQDNLKATENGWIDRTQLHNSLIQQYDNELLAIKQAEDALKQGGVFRQ